MIIILYNMCGPWTEHILASSLVAASFSSRWDPTVGQSSVWLILGITYARKKSLVSRLGYYSLRFIRSDNRRQDLGPNVLDFELWICAM